MYSVSSEINGEGDIQSGYTQNVMFNGFRNFIFLKACNAEFFINIFILSFGIILGPILSGSFFKI
jgi:hypothetical protein